MNDITKPHRFALLILMSVLFLSASIPTSAQLDRYLVVIPTLTLGGDYAGDYDLKGVKLVGDGYIDWGRGNPRSISSLAVKEFDATGIPDGNGGLFLAYTIEHSDSANMGDRDILVRHLDRDGNDIWEDSVTGPVRFVAESEHIEQNPVIIPSGSGAIVVYEMKYKSGDFKGDVDIVAVGIDSDGRKIWDNASWVANAQGQEWIRGVYPDKAGNAVVVYEWNTTKNVDARSCDILASRISADGRVGWSANASQPVVIAASGHSEERAAVRPDGSGGAYIAYELHYLSGDRKGDVDIIAQHLTNTGEREWTDPTAPPIVSSGRTVLETSPSITSDSAGVTVGFTIASTTGGKARTDAGIQRLNLKGQPVWFGGSRSQVVSVAHRSAQNTFVNADGLGNTYVTVEATDSITGDTDVFVQYLDERGNPMWGRKGSALPAFQGPMPEGYVTSLSDSYGGVIIIGVQKQTFRVDATGQNDSSIIAQRFDRFGKQTWNLGESNLILAQCPVGEHQVQVIRAQ